MTIDLDALVSPIELAETAADARAAVWAVLKTIRNRTMPKQAMRNLLAVIDTAAWVAGLSEGFRGNAYCTVYLHAYNEDGFSVIPGSFPERMPTNA